MVLVLRGWRAVVTGRQDVVVTSTDWDAWHASYREPASPLSRRLRVIQEHISDWLEETAPEPVTVVSTCAGDGKDLLGVLAARKDASRVQATLPELDGRNVDRAEVLRDTIQPPPSPRSTSPR
jgi:hypothetical protein